MASYKSSLVMGIGCQLLTFSVLAANQCTYSTYKWNTISRSAVEYRRIEKAYSQLLPYEVDAATGCSVCEQDQVEIELNGTNAFKVCRVLAGPLRTALLDVIDKGVPIEKIIGYRVGMTRGDIDEKGNRTQFSNHSFGIAIDINPDQNGLYDHCVEYNSECRLIKGGAWLPDIDKRSLTENSVVVKALEKIGLKWGGEIAGKQKDFMHFSPTGY
ncbi:MAG: M15 family metallopeptidase [Gammaproteobacteria bacterium]|nr:M15 family metallopeptidase [Gammaproteobacteria bacterium]